MGLTLPQNLEAEAAVLGAVLQEEWVLAEISQLLIPEDFSVPKHRLIFQTMLDLEGSMAGVNIITVREILNRTAEGRSVTDHDLAALADPMHVLPSQAVSYARIVKDSADRRRLVKLGQDLARQASKGEDPAQDLLAWIEQQLLPLTAGDRHAHRVTDPPSFGRYMETYEAAKGLITGLDLFDQHVGGLTPGNLVVVAGRPGIGKTALGVQIATHLACKEGIPVLFLSPEMTKAEIGWRVLTLLSGRTHFEVRMGKWDLAAMETLKRSGFHIADEAEPNVDRLRSLIRASVRARATRAVFLDHIGKVRGTRTENRYQEVGEVARKLKAVAKDLSVPVFALCQLNREVEKRTTSRPRLSDLRDSGAIEEEADVVAFLWSTEERLIKPNLPVTLSIAKNRHGALEEHQFTFRRPYLRLDPVSPGDGE